jgi:hypothetical protein
MNAWNFDQMMILVAVLLTNFSLMMVVVVLVTIFTRLSLIEADVQRIIKYTPR